MASVSKEDENMWLPWLVAKYGVETVAAHRGVSTDEIWAWVDDAEAADERDDGVELEPI